MVHIPEENIQPIHWSIRFDAAPSGNESNGQWVAQLQSKGRVRIRHTTEGCNYRHDGNTVIPYGVLEDYVNALIRPFTCWTEFRVLLLIGTSIHVCITVLMPSSSQHYFEIKSYPVF